MPDYIKQLIAGGEGQTLDFKFEVSDFRKIARTLVAFANTDGGRLLVGVKDNGAIAGIRSEEEYFMVEGAARMYCKPEVKFSVKEWQVERRRVMEVTIERGDIRPYTAMDEEGLWIAYIRQGDQNFKASRIMLKVWAQQQAGHATTIRFREGERALLSYLEQHRSITVSKFCRMAGLSLEQAENILTGFSLLKIIRPEYSMGSISFYLTDDYRTIIESMANRT